MKKPPAQLQLFGKVSFRDKLFFTKHLATMVKSGIPIVDALTTLAAHNRSGVFKKTINSVIAAVENGSSLAAALKQHPKIFDQFYISLIEIGEESGTLEENLEFLSQQLNKDYNLKKKIQSALMYPMVVLSAAVIMGGFISLYILPKLVDFFGSFEIDLPVTTKILLFLALTMKNYGVMIFASLILLALVFAAVVKIPKVKPVWHRALLRFPLFGELIRFGQLARFARNLGVLLKSGVPANRALVVAAETMANITFVNELKSTASQLERGKKIAEAMEKNKNTIFPPLVTKMISVGEQTGKLDETLLYLGDFYEDEVDNISKNLSTMLEPILLITIGLVVGFIALAIITPIYELTGSIRR